MPTGKVDHENLLIIKGLQKIPGVGPSIAHDLLMLGINSIDDLRGRDPEALYAVLSALYGKHIDRCVLYVFRCAVYFASCKQRKFNSEVHSLKCK